MASVFFVFLWTNLVLIANKMVLYNAKFDHVMSFSSISSSWTGKHSGS